MVPKGVFTQAKNNPPIYNSLVTELIIMKILAMGQVVTIILYQILVIDSSKKRSSHLEL